MLDYDVVGFYDFYFVFDEKILTIDVVRCTVGHELNGALGLGKRFTWGWTLLFFFKIVYYWRRSMRMHVSTYTHKGKPVAITNLSSC